jgi:hypothetical protein
MRIAYAIAVAMALLAAAPAGAADMDWTKVDQALGKKGADQPGGVHKYSLPRSDLHVTVDGVALRPAFALGGWLAFEPVGGRAMVMGDLVLTEDEINPVMAKLLADGITITALHNHLLRAQPATLYMHVAAEGDPVKLATALHDGLSASKTPLGAAPAAQPAPAAPPALDVNRLDQILGRKGAVAGDVVQFAFPRADSVEDGGMKVPPPMGTAISINFQPAGDGKAAITGDFVLTASEVNPVLQALRQSGIEVTAVHNHMLDDQPHMFFVHFWAHGDSARLAEGLRTALDRVNVAKS